MKTNMKMEKIVGFEKNKVNKKDWEDAECSECSLGWYFSREDEKQYPNLKEQHQFRGYAYKFDGKNWGGIYNYAKNALIDLRMCKNEKHNFD